MGYRITGLSPDNFASFWNLDDQALEVLHMRRLIAKQGSSYPCRVSLEDAREGETLLLLPYTHHDVAGPYRASGPIYVRRLSRPATIDDRIPPYLSRRLLSVRAYDATGWMTQADVVEGRVVEEAITGLLDRDEVAYLHLHNARQGCYFCRVDRT